MTLSSQLNTLESSGLIRLVQAQPELEYLFRHALVQEAAYDSLLKQDRKRLHLAVGDALERTYPARLEELAPVLAGHFDEAGDDERALKYFALAGDVASRQYANAEALTHYTCALEVAMRSALPTPKLYRARGLVYDTLGDFERARADLEAALQVAQIGADRGAEWQALLDLGLLWASRDYAQTREYYQRALALARSSGDRVALAHSLNRIGNWYLNVEQPVEALQHHQEALGIFRGLSDRRGIATTLDLLGMASFISGDLMRGTAHFDQAVRLFREVDDRHGLASSLTTLTLRGATYQTDTVVPAAGTLVEAARDGESALQIARDIGSRAAEAYALCALGFCLGSQGAYERALSSAQASLAIAAEIGHRQWLAAAHCTLGELYLDLLAPVEARQYLEQALALAHEVGSMLWVHFATAFLAQTYLLQNEPEPAEAVLDTARGFDTHAQTLGQRLCWCARAELALARDDPAQALQIVDRLIASAANLNGGHVIPRLWKLRGEALAALHQVEEAGAVLQAAREAALAQGTRPMLWRIHTALGKVFAAHACQTEAEREFSAAQTMIEQLAANIPEASIRDTFLQRAMAMIPLEAGRGRDL